MKPARLLRFAAISVALALPAGGFVLGFLQCEDCGANIFGRALVGVIFAVLTPLSGGFPPRNEGGVGDPFNAWPHIIVTGLAIFAGLCLRERSRLRKAAALAAIPPDQGAL